MSLFEIPIITYHKISPEKEFGVTTISPDRFEDQIQYLIRFGFKTITFKEYFFFKRENLPQNPIIITFDDSYQSVYDYAFPIMVKYNYRGVLFVISNFIGKKSSWEAYQIQKKYNHASVSQLKEMQMSGFEIASHSESHPYLPALSKTDAFKEVDESKKKLEDIFDENIYTFCYPYGRYSTKVIDQVAKAGYKFATGNMYNKHKKFNHNLAINRRSIYSIDTISMFSKKIKSNARISYIYIIEKFIQMGSLAGILKKILEHNIYSKT